MKITLQNTVSEIVLNDVERWHFEYEAQNGVACNYWPFYITAENNGEIVGVLNAYTAFSEIYVEDLCVNPNFRRHGIGREMLTYLFDFFLGKGFENINLVTNQFQAKEFYTKCGFDLEFIRESKTNPKLTKFFFVKYFNK